MFANVMKKYVPGFENSFLLDHGGRAVNRSCTHIDNSSLVGEIFDTPIYIFKTMYHYQEPKPIPYRVIMGEKIENLLVIGKGAYQSESFRAQISCMLMGIAAAAVGKTIVGKSNSTYQLDVEELKMNLNNLA